MPNILRYFFRRIPRIIENPILYCRNMTAKSEYIYTVRMIYHKIFG